MDHPRRVHTLFTANRESIFLVEEKEGRVEKKGTHVVKV